MSTYNIQQTIHLLSLPNDIANYINSYLFYDKITGEYRRETRIKMKNVVESFKYACQSRNYSYNTQYQDVNENCEHWAVWMADRRLENLIDSNEIQIQGMNCKLCGEYIASGSLLEIPNRARCNC
jgi:hypothetical protein